MRFLILTQYFYPETGAAPTRLAAVAQELVNNGHEVEVVTGFPNYPGGTIFPQYRGRLWMREQWQGLPIFRTWLYASMGAGFKRVLNYCSLSASSLFALLTVRRPDWILVNSPPLTLALPALIMSRRFSARLIVNVSDLWPDCIADLGIVKNEHVLQWMQRVELFIYRHADRVNAITEGIRHKLIEVKGVPSHKVAFLPNGVDTKLFRPMSPHEDLKASLGLSGKFIVLYAGTLGYAHSLEHVLYAASRLRERSHIHFLFVGGGSEKTKLMRLADTLRLQNVSFHNPAPASEMPNYLSVASCGLVTQRNLPVYHSNRPAKMFPIMAAGKPVVFSGDGEAADLVNGATSGIVVPPEDPDALAHAIEVLAESDSLRDVLGVCGRQYVERHFTWERLVHDWLQDLGVASSAPIRNVGVVV